MKKVQPQGEKRCEIKGGGQEVIVMVGYYYYLMAKNFINDSSGEFGATS